MRKTKQPEGDPSYRWVPIVVFVGLVVAAILAAVASLWLLDGHVTAIQNRRLNGGSTFSGVFILFVVIGVFVTVPLWGLRDKLLLKDLLRKYGLMRALERDREAEELAASKSAAQPSNARDAQQEAPPPIARP